MQALGRWRQENYKDKTRLSYTVRPHLKRKTGKEFHFYGYYSWKHDDKTGAIKVKQLFFHNTGHVGQSPHCHLFKLY